MFYCTECDDFEEFNGDQLIRHVRLESKKGKDRVESPSGLRLFDSKKIVSWTEKEGDTPNWEELEEKYGIEDDQILDGDENEEDLPLRGDKLGGFPMWVQSVEYPDCPEVECEKEMRMVFQLDSEDNINYMFGDVGCGHITQCPVHKYIFAFRWACS